MATDWLTTMMAFLSFNCYRFFHMMKGDTLEMLRAYLCSGKLLLEEIFVPIALLFIYWLSGFYNRPFERSRLVELFSTMGSAGVNALLIYLAALTNDQLMMRRENWMLILVLFMLLFFFTYAGRLIITSSIIRKFREGKLAFRTIVIGPLEAAADEAQRLEQRKFKTGIHIAAIFPTEGMAAQDKQTPFPVVCDFAEVKRLSAAGEIHQAIIVPGASPHKEKMISTLLHELFPLEIAIRIKPDMLSFLTPSIRLQDIKGEPLIDITSPVVTECTKNLKRTFDILASGMAMLLLSPLYATLAILVKRSSPGPAIYSQERIGLHGRPFRIYKFRSMVTDAESSGPRLSSDEDPRITPIGKILRKYRLDELPQFFNVFRGDMSIVGPRPERAYYIDRIIKVAPWYSLVHQVRPGITSWGMVKYGYAASVEQMVERNRFDLIYLANMSIAVDFKIMIYTVKTVITGEGV